jgi:trimethylamine--corrinoid protein Co-methyltransferase
MAAEVAGGMDALQEKPFVILYPESISPLVFSEEVVDRIFIAADLRMPQMMGPSIQPGATGPVTLAGAIVQSIAESLMGIVIAQLRKPGTPCGLGVNYPILDMGTGLITVGSPEMSLALCGQAEVARSFGLPSWGLAGGTDSKIIDAQAGIESAFSILSQGLGGLNLIHDVGYMDGAMVVSPEQLVLGNEVIGMTKRFIEGIRVNKGTLAKEIIERIGPGGNFLQEEHTAACFKSELWRPRLLTRQSRVSWEKKGSKSMEQRIREELKKIIETHRPHPLPDKTIAAMDRIIQRQEKAIAGK